MEQYLRCDTAAKRCGSCSASSFTTTMSVTLAPLHEQHPLRLLHPVTIARPVTQYVARSAGQQLQLPRVELLWIKVGTAIVAYKHTMKIRELEWPDARGNGLLKVNGSAGCRASAIDPSWFQGSSRYSHCCGLRDAFRSIGAPARNRLGSASCPE